MSPRRVRLSRARGWKLPANTVTVARPTRWGNPFRVGAPGIPDIATAVARYREASDADDPRLPPKTAIRAALRGKDLACWCPLDGPCHADVLLEIANGDAQDQVATRRRRVISRVGRPSPAAPRR